MGMLGKNAKIGIGASPSWVQGVRSIELDYGDIVVTESDNLDDDPPVVYPGGQAAATITVTVEKKTTDTNGQLALNTAHAAKSFLAITVAPEGSTTGSTKQTGSALVQSVGKETLNKKDIVTRTYVLKVSGGLTPGTFSA
jgi:hypothetical protein